MPQINLNNYRAKFTAMANRAGFNTRGSDADIIALTKMHKMRSGSASEVLLNEPITEANVQDMINFLELTTSRNAANNKSAEVLEQTFLDSLADVNVDDLKGMDNDARQ